MIERDLSIIHNDKTVVDRGKGEMGRVVNVFSCLESP